MSQCSQRFLVRESVNARSCPCVVCARLCVVVGQKDTQTHREGERA